MKGLKLDRLDKMHGITYRLRPWSKMKETTTTVFVRPGGVTKGGAVIRPTIQDWDRNDPWGLNIPYRI